MKLFHDLMHKVRATDKNYDLCKIEQAFELANTAHAGQKRKSGEPYISHPIAVAEILLDLCMDTDTIVSALLHDVVEDTDIALDDLRRQFSDDVAELVDGVTKIGMIHLNTIDTENSIENRSRISTEEERKAENIRKILVAMFKDVRVIIIKLADRLHNMRTLSTFRPEKQKRIALETMTFYAPIAHRLGIAHMKEEMEKLSLFYLDSFAYEAIEKSLELHKKERDGFIEKIIARISERLVEMEPAPVIEGRVKGIYSLYKKMYINGKTLDEIYDVYAIRVIVHTTVDCYNVLGVVHDMYTPVQTCLKDYIASPKVNGYQSLHTIVLGKEKQPFEVQIRTHDMHRTARYGVAAHWRYKLGLKPQSCQSKFDFIRQLLDQQQQADDVENIANVIKNELTDEEVHVLTPQGKVISLPAGSTVVDFAYKVHTDVGNEMTGAKVHGKVVNYGHVLKTGDIVQIISAGSSPGPSRSWLDYAKTSNTRTIIRKWLKNERKEENISSGRAFVESLLRRNGVKIEPEVLIKFAAKRGFKALDDFYASIGYGGIEHSDATMWLEEELGISKRTKSFRVSGEEYEEYVEQNRKKKQSISVLVEGMQDCLVKFASCCNPLPGDEIVGFITRGHGVSIHKDKCDNITSRRMLSQYRQRLVGVSWTQSAQTFYAATIEITAVNRKGLLMDISTAIANSQIFIESGNLRTLKNSNAFLNFTVEISNVEHLESLMKKLDKIPSVISVERTGK
jgi:GTP pyrophosphokinase